VTPALYVHGAVPARLARLPARPFEVGGWLLGYWSEDRSSLFVTHATPPLSRGTPFGVHISGRGHRKLFDQAWDASDGLVTFLGDWHTHPGSLPLPSVRDKRALAKLATEPRFDTPEPLIAIVSTPRFPWHEGENAIALYLGDAKGKPTPLAPTVVAELPPEAAAVPEWRWPPRRSRRGKTVARS
jgi:integrative and conjugative element protein (TIGR02256 family)